MGRFVNSLNSPVLEAVQSLPDDSSLQRITEELQIMAAVRRGRADIAAGRTKTHEEAQRLLESRCLRQSVASA